jgi:hypothetical protein
MHVREEQPRLFPVAYQARVSSVKVVLSDGLKFARHFACVLHLSLQPSRYARYSNLWNEGFSPC